MTGRIASKLTTNSQCTHWVSDPSPPVPASSDAGKEPSSSTGGGEWGHPSGDGDLEVSAGLGAGDVGPRCAGVSGLCLPPSDDEVELLLFFALSS